MRKDSPNRHNHWFTFSGDKAAYVFIDLWKKHIWWDLGLVWVFYQSTNVMYCISQRTARRKYYLPFSVPSYIAQTCTPSSSYCSICSLYFSPHILLSLSLRKMHMVHSRCFLLTARLRVHLWLHFNFVTATHQMIINFTIYEADTSLTKS